MMDYYDDASSCCIQRVLIKLVQSQEANVQAIEVSQVHDRYQH
jgi:hypothetical protein